ncbi:MAG: hypothetical protein LBR64_02870 [Dysgonamonadaceae bacterium]|nr:hypothetical protein [Dysgonamonadaceae bacterium]
MKKTFIFISIFVLCMQISAQTTSEYNDLIHSIDSLKIKYSVKRFLFAGDFLFDFQSNYGKKLAFLQEEEQNKIIDYVYELYNQKAYIGLYGLAGELLKGFYDFSDRENIRKRIIEIWYDKICYMSSVIVSIGKSSDYTDKVKDRLLEIVEKKWRAEDINAWTVFIEQNLNMDEYKREAKKIMENYHTQHDKITEKYLLDSIVRSEKEKRLNLYMNRPVSRSCILMIGSLNDNRFIPCLERIFEENENNAEIKEGCIFALAKSGVQAYLDSVYKQKTVHFRYLGTKEAFLKWVKLNFNWNEWDHFCSNCSDIPQSLKTIRNAQDVLLNVFPKELKLTFPDIENFVSPANIQDYDPTKDKQNKEVIQKINKIYQWFFDNKEKLELPPAEDYF